MRTGSRWVCLHLLCRFGIRQSERDLIPVLRVWAVIIRNLIRLRTPISGWGQSERDGATDPNPPFPNLKRRVDRSVIDPSRFSAFAAAVIESQDALALDRLHSPDHFVIAGKVEFKRLSVI